MEKKGEGDVCPPCVEPIQQSICQLVDPKHRGECRRRFLTDPPEDFIRWLKSIGVTTEQFLKALEEGRGFKRDEGVGNSRGKSRGEEGDG